MGVKDFKLTMKFLIQFVVFIYAIFVVSVGQLNDLKSVLIFDSMFFIISLLASSGYIMYIRTKSIFEITLLDRYVLIIIYVIIQSNISINLRIILMLVQ